MREAFDSAKDLRGEARCRFLAESCGEDQEVLSEVERLLAAHSGAGSFIDTVPLPDFGSLGETALEDERRDLLKPGECLKDRYVVATEPELDAASSKQLLRPADPAPQTMIRLEVSRTAGPGFSKEQVASGTGPLLEILDQH